MSSTDFQGKIVTIERCHAAVLCMAVMYVVIPLSFILKCIMGMFSVSRLLRSSVVVVDLILTH